MEMKSEKAPSIRTEESALREDLEGILKALHLEPRNSVLAVTTEARFFIFPFLSQLLVVKPGLPHQFHSISATARCTPTPVLKLYPYSAAYRQCQSSSGKL